MDVTLDNIFSMLETMPGNYLVLRTLEMETEFLYYTKGIPALSGNTEKSYKLIRSPYDLILEEDRVVIENKTRECLADPDFVEEEFLFRLIHREKGFIWVHMTAKKAGIIDGYTVYILNLVDATKETLISYALMEASDRYICVIEKATKRFLYANQGFYDLVDCSPSEAMGKHCYEILCKAMEMRDNDNCMCYGAINAEPPIDMYNPQKDKYLTLTGREIVWGEYNAYVFYMSDVTEKKRKDEQLEDSRKRFNVALDNSGLMIWEYDMVNHLCINSEKAGRDYDIPLIIENYPESLFETGHTPPETIEQIKDVQRRLQNGETGFSVERRTIDKFGKSNWQKVEYTLECDAEGKPLRAIVCGLDITERKELEQKYEEQMEYRNKLAQNAMFSIRLDLDDNSISDYTCIDASIEEIVKNSRNAADFLNMFFRPAVFDDDSQLTPEKLTAEALRESFLMGQSQYKSTYRCDFLNMYLELNLNMYKNPGNGHLEVFYLVTDVTGNVLRQEALQGVVGKDYDFVAVINADTGEMMMLAHSKKSLAYDELKSDQKLYYDPVIMQFADSHRQEYYSEEDFHSVSDGMQLSVVKEKLRTMKVYEFNCKAKLENSELQTFRLSFNYADDAKTQILFTRANITHMVQEERLAQLKLEDALKAAKLADQAKTDFLSRMSHDMRTPMNGIIGMTQLTRDTQGLSEEVQANLAAISDSSAYLLQLINDTLDMNKIESNRFVLKPEIVDSEELMRHILATIAPMAEKKKIDLQFIPINAKMGYIFADRVRIQQLFLNLLSNAVKFTAEGGRVRLSVECLKLENETAYDRIIVEDNGRGMSKEFLEHVFEPFSQEKNEIISGQEGTGLGMTIVKNLVEQMGGSIEIDSTPDVGTKITVCISFKVVKDIPEKAEQHRQNQVELSGKKVLLVEDHPLNATIAIRLLEKKSMIVDTAENGKRAVEMFAASGINAYDIILMDIRMPVMNGIDAAKKIREMNRKDAASIPIVAMTANAYDDDVRKTREAGMDAHIAKPVEPEIMYDVIVDMLSRQDNR